MKKGYEFIEHTADVEFVAYGKTLEETFGNALLAFFETVADIGALSKSELKSQSFKINDRARTIDDLLWFTLQDALSISDAEGLYGYSVKNISVSEELGEYSVNATVAAKKKSQKFSQLDVKGVSKFDLKVVKTKSGFEASVVLDV